IAVTKLRQQPDDIELDHIIAVNLTDALPTTLRLALHLPLPSLRKRRAALTAPAPDTISWSRLLDNRGLKPSHPRPDVHDLAAIQYTSGTTGQPKGAMLSHFNLYSNARQGAAWMHGAVERQEVFYAVLPMFHGFGMTLFLTYGVLKQARIHLFPMFDVSLVLAAAKKHPPTVFCAVPPIFEKTAATAKARRIPLTSAKYCISGAMTLPQSTVELWESVSGGLLVEGYGMTEASPVALGNPFWPTRRTGTIGVPFPSTRMRVVDPDNPATDVAQGERGELLLAGPQIFQGYWNNPEETALTLLPGGWLRTGDIVTQDADGFTTIVDRKKELIITGGFNVAPSEVELVLKSHSGVADAAVVGLPHPHSGEEVVAVVVTEDGRTLDPDELNAYCRERLAAYKVPRRVFFAETLPVSMLGKVLRAQVRQDLLDHRQASA
ncbi:MAG: AMP-binding protein, partial [Propionibacteriaceae bacterium]|nr:AMP-binding protein [Propionibacteriaceae bacterium]